MKRAHFAVNTSTGIIFMLVVMVPIFVNCGKDKPTESSESLCERLTVDNLGHPCYKIQRDLQQ
jgi:hypothetical protein